MDRLALHIEYLLLRHNCVVVPDFGAFINVRHKAITDCKSGIISPMSREVRFNGALRHDDGMLAASYSRREKISYAEARDMVSQAVSRLRDALATDGEAPVGRLGHVSADSNGVIVFHPALPSTALASRLGYYPAHIVSPAVVSAPHRDTASSQPATPAADNADSSTHPQWDTDRNYYIAINKRFANIAAMFLVTLMIAVSTILPFKMANHEDQASIVPVKAITAIAKTAVTAPAELKSVEDAPAEEASVEDAPAEDWHLIVATFRTEAEADSFIAANDGNGYSLAVVPSSRLCRVSARSAVSKEDLIPELNSHAFQSRFPQAWIFHSRPK